MRRGSLIAAALCLSPLCLDISLAQTASSPAADVATLLFDQPMWRAAPAGSTLHYGFSRRAGRQPLGASFDDDILITLGAGSDAASRTCEIAMYSGKHARAAGPFFSTKINPVLVLVLEQNVQELGRLTGIDPSRLKQDIRTAWHDDARIITAPIEVAGRHVSGTRIIVTPFGNEPDRDKMKGLDALTYAVEIADAVPGHIARVDIRTPAGSAFVFSETLRYAGKRAR